MKRAAPFVVLMLVVAAMMSPLLLDGRPGILDTAVMHDACARFTWRQPLQLFNILGVDNQARPLQFLQFLPAFVSRDVRVYHLFQNGLVLLLTLYLCSQVLYYFSRQKVLAVLGAACALLTPSFTANYFTWGTAEPCMLFGLYGVLFVLVRLLAGENATRRSWWWYNGIGIMFVMYAMGLKEPGVMVLPVCAAAGFLLARLEKVSWRAALRRCWPLGLAAVLVCSAVVIKYMSNATVYDAGGTGGYALAPALVLQSLRRFLVHFMDTCPYAFFSVPACLFAMVVFDNTTASSDNACAFTRAITGVVIFFIIAAGMAAIYVPWQVFDARQLLLSSSSAVAATVLTIHALSVVLRMRIHALGQLVMMNLVLLLSTLLVLHVLFTLAIGPLSRGLVTHKFACAYDDMFHYMAAQTPSNGTAYFMMNTDFAEPIENTRIGMRVFYDRPDIYCAFPQKKAAFAEQGLVAATTLKDFSFNYTRMPVHAAASAIFSEWKSNDLRFVLVTSFVYRTPVLYAKDEYNVPQYKAWWGLPAFWELKRGVYHFGWSVYRFAGHGAEREEAAVLAPGGQDLVRDGSFARGWQCWDVQDARMTQTVAVVAADAPDAGTALCLEYRHGPILHVRQHITLKADAVYRLSGLAKLVAPAYPEVMGMRLAVFMPDQKEVGLVWDYVHPNEWERQQMVFTNALGGGAVVYIEMGSRRGARTALVTEVRLEEVAK